jgi:hypothetical protein
MPLTGHMHRPKVGLKARGEILFHRTFYAKVKEPTSSYVNGFGAKHDRCAVHQFCMRAVKREGGLVEVGRI